MCSYAHIRFTYIDTHFLYYKIDIYFFNKDIIYISLIKIPNFDILTRDYIINFNIAQSVNVLKLSSLTYYIFRKKYRYCICNL